MSLVRDCGILCGRGGGGGLPLCMRSETSAAVRWRSAAFVAVAEEARRGSAWAG